MAAMTPEQQRAHNMLHLTMWLEWEEFCRAYKPGFDSAENIQAVDKWGDKAVEVYTRAGRGYFGWRHGAYKNSDFVIGDEYYTWMDL